MRCGAVVCLVVCVQSVCDERVVNDAHHYVHVVCVYGHPWTCSSSLTL
jgi:hypothetical protein